MKPGKYLTKATVRVVSITYRALLLLCRDHRSILPKIHLLSYFQRSLTRSDNRQPGQDHRRRRLLCHPVITVLKNVFWATHKRTCVFFFTSIFFFPSSCYILPEERTARAGNALFVRE